MGSFSAEEYFYKVDNMVLGSCQLLRQLFQTRWKVKMGTDWDSTEEQGKSFLDSQDGDKVQKNCKPLHKKLIERGCLDEWDLTLLSIVLQNFGDDNLYKGENDAVRQITQLRNELAHHPTKKLSREEYNTKVGLFRENLLLLRVELSEIEKIIDKAGITSSEVALVEATKKLLKQGKKHMEDGEFHKAIACFDEATTLPSLLPEHEGAVYEKRADCYLKQAKHLKQNQLRSDGDRCVEQAMLDATLALQLNDNSWNAHFLLAQCHRWNVSLGKAIQHYNLALALSPAQKHVKRELDSCKLLEGARETDDNLSSQNAPRTFAEEVEKVAEVTGVKMTEEQFITQETSVLGTLIKGQEDVFRGHQYRSGWSVPQSYEQAAHHYAKAAEVGNSEGIYNLAVCYSSGKGVAQDLEKAYKLLLQAANMTPNDPSSGGKVGVLHAQHTLGLWFHQGFFVEQDYLEAVKWYEKALENGCGGSANNLGLMFAHGEGVLRNEKKAEMYWTLAVILRAATAAVLLMHYYIRHLEPERARTMFRTGKELGSNELNLMSEDEFNKMVEPRSEVRKRVETDVIEYERKHKCETKGMTFLERLQRKRIGEDSNLEKVLKNIQQMVGTSDNEGARFPTESDVKLLSKMKKEGSKTAENVLNAMSTAQELALYIMQNECGSEKEKSHALELLYNCCIGAYDVASIYLLVDPVKDKLKPVIGELFDTKCGEKGEQDMKIRLCYVYYFKGLATTTRDTFLIDILKEGVKIYPDNVHFYEMLSNLYGFARDPKSALEWVEKGLKKFPISVDLLFSKACYLRQLPESRYQDIVAAYNEFLSHAPPDHRFIPEAYYNLAIVEFELLYEINSELKLVELVEQYFNMGKEAEGRMLPIYLPYRESEVKRRVENVLALAKSRSGASFGAESQPAPKPILERKQYLDSPVRKRVILKHRRNLNHFLSEVKKLKDPVGVGVGITSRLTQTTPSKLSRLKPITLSEMNPTTEHVFEDRIINLTLIEDPYFSLSTIFLVAEDENGDVTHLYVYNVDQNQKTGMNLAHGSTIAIMNPYMAIMGSRDGTSLRNDEPRCLLSLDKVEKMCRFCGEENAAQKCSRCKKVYCSRECQELDWKLFKHKLICSI